MPITFGALVGSMAKGYVKEQIKRKGIEIIDRAVRNNIKSAAIKKGAYLVFASDKDKYSIKDLDKDLKIFSKYIKSVKAAGSVNIPALLRTNNYLLKNKDNVFFSPKSNLKVTSLYESIIDYALKSKSFKIDEDSINQIFSHNSNIELTKSEMNDILKKLCDHLYNLGYLDYKNGSYHLNEKSMDINFSKLNSDDFEKLYKLNIYDKIIFDVSQIKNGAFTFSDLKKESKELIRKSFGNTNQADEIYKIFIDYTDFRLDQLANNGFLNIRFTSNGSRCYQATEIFLNSLEKQDLFKNINEVFADPDFKVNNMQKYILRIANESNELSINSLAELFKIDPKIDDFERKLKLAINACDKLTNNGYLEYRDNSYFITNKGIEYIKDLGAFEINYSDLKTLNMIIQNNNFLDIPSLKDRFISKDSAAFLDNLDNVDVVKELDIRSVGKNYISNTFCCNSILNSLNKNESISSEAIFNDFKGVIKNYDDITKKNIQAYFLNILTDADYITLSNIDNTYFITDKGKAHINSINDFNITQGKLKSLELNGCVEIKDQGYIITDKAVDSIFNYRDLDTLENCLYEYCKSDKYAGVFDIESFINSVADDSKTYQNLLKQFPYDDKKSSEFIFGKYDANVIFKEFEDNGSSLTEDALRDSLLERYNSIDLAEKQFNIIISRIKKNVDNGFISFNEDDKVYKITDKGLEAAKKINDGFSFSSYDTNVIFGYVSRANGALSQELLSNYINDEFNNRSYADKRLDYINKRIAFNVEEGYLYKDSEGFYRFTDKGIDIENRKLNALKQGIKEKIDFLTVCNLLSKDGANNLHISSKFENIVDKKLNFYDNLIFQFSSEYIDTGISKEQILDLGKDHYINIYGATKKAEFSYLSFEDHFNKRLDSLIKIGYFHNVDDRLYVSESFCLAYEKYNYDRLIFNLSEQFEDRKFSLPDFKEAFIDYYYINYFDSDNMENANFYFDSFLKNNINKLTKYGLLHYDSESETYEVTEKYINNINKYNHVYNPKLIDKPSKYHLYLLKDAIENKGISLDVYKEKFLNDISIDDADKKLQILQRTCDKLAYNGLLNYKDGIYYANDKAINLYYSSKGFSNIEKYIYDYAVNNKEFTKDLFTRDLINNKKFLNTIRNDYTGKSDNKEFSFSKYDAFVIFKEFDKNTMSLTCDKLKDSLYIRYNDDKEVNKQLDIYMKRINKLVNNGYVSYDSKSSTFILTQKGLNAASNARNKFTFTSYDANVIFGYINKANGSMTEGDLLNFLKQEIFQVSYLEDQYKYLTGRINKNIKAGYLSKDKDGCISITPNGMNKANEIYIPAIQLFYDKLELFSRYGYLNFDSVNYFLSESFSNLYQNSITIINDDVPKQINNINFKLSNLDINILKELIGGSVSINSKSKYFSSKYADKPHEANRQLKMYNGRWKKLQELNFVNVDNKGNITITDDGRNIFNRHISSKHNFIGTTTDNFVLNSYDKHILKLALDELNFNERKEFFINRHKDNSKEIERQMNMLSGRCRKLDDKGYLIKTDKGYKITGVGLDALNIKVNNIIEPNPNKQYSKYKLTKFDLNNIANHCIDGKWTKDNFIKCNPGLDVDMLNKKINSIEKRMDVLLEMKLADVDKEGYVLDKSFFDRVNLIKEKGINRFTNEQKDIVITLSNFLNLSDKQIESFFYKDRDIFFKSDLKYLVDKGYLGVVSRDLKCNGEFTKIYYLTTEGKKAASHFTGVQVNKIFDSKLHSRPVELRHDLLVYSAFKDIENKLAGESCAIISSMTDKQMRSFDMSTTGKQRIEYSDLYIEFFDLKTNEKGYINLEIDCGYKANVIKSKAENIENLVWYTDSAAQANRIEKTISNAKIVTLQF